jgi:hypothetical protein
MTTAANECLHECRQISSPVKKRAGVGGRVVFLACDFDHVGSTLVVHKIADGLCHLNSAIKDQWRYLSVLMGVFG